MINYRISLFITGLITICFTACASGGVASTSPDADDPRFNFAASDARRISSPNASESEIRELIEGNTEFALELYQALKDGDENLFYSPYSLSQALAMLFAGASGQTESEMVDTLHFTLPQAGFHPRFNALDLDLATRGEKLILNPGDEPSFQLHVANSIWGYTEQLYLPQFLDTLACNYGAGLRQVNFVGDPEGSRQIINAWIEENTRGRIMDMIPEGDLVSDATALVLVNTIYFKALWMMPFDEDDTTDADFHLLDGSVISTSMMEFDDPVYQFQYAKGDGWEAIDLPYVTHLMQVGPSCWYEVSMLVLIPDEGLFREFEDSLDRERLQEIIDELEYYSVNLFFPKFSFESYFQLKDVLSGLGMPSAFLGGLSGIDGGAGGLFVRDVLHKAWISVDERGTEAAAASAIGVDCMGPEGGVLTVDRPFIFLIRDNKTGTILFAGRLLDPTR